MRRDVVKKLRGLASRPDEIEVTTPRVNVSATAGAFIAAAGSGANFGVMVRWARKAEETSRGPGGSP